MTVGFDRVFMVGDSVRLRPAQASDAAEAYRLVNDEAVLSRLVWDGPESEEQMSGTFRQWHDRLAAGQDYNLVIERSDEPGLIGCISARLINHPLQADVGYWLGARYWNQGYITDAVRLMCHFCFQYLESARAYATVFVGNMGSRRALEKNGFSLDGTLRCNALKRGEWRDEWFFSLLRSEWEQEPARFRPGREDVVVARKHP